MSAIIIENWPPDPDKREFRKIIKRFVDDGKTYNEIVHIVRETFVRIVLLKSRDQSLREVFKKYQIKRTSFNYWLKKYKAKKGDIG